LIIGTKAVFPNGDKVVSGGKTVKNVSGYDMSKLLIGSYGTLGIICEMTWRLLPLPEKKATLLIPFAQLKGAESFVYEILNSPLIPASIETLNARAVEKIRDPVPMSSEGNYLIAIGLEGVAESIDRQISEMGERSKKHEAFKPVILYSEKHDGFWKAIRDFSEALTKNYPNLIALKLNFPISKWGEILGNSEKIAKGLGMDCAFACHSGNGILYTYIGVGKDIQSKIEPLVKLIEELTSEVVKNGGNLVVESCPLPVKEKVDVWGQPRADYRIARRLKEEIDPVGILNPGRFIGGI
jgi:glycolate oxidase FAD binding subunit